MQATPRDARIDVEDVDHVVTAMRASAIPLTTTSPALILAHGSPLRLGGGRPWIIIDRGVVGQDGSMNQRHDIGLGSRNAFDSDHIHAARDEVRHLVADMETDQCSPQWR